MCGIAATFAYSGGLKATDVAQLRQACSLMAARGPDAEGLFEDPEGRIVLGHRRLAIIDLSPGGAQPMHSDDGRLTVTYNGEIYNYRALRDELLQAGVRLRSASDTEVLLHLYTREGPAFVRRLRGMFAFALYDAERQGLLLARDPYGIKPLYLSDDGERLQVASQVRVLRTYAGVDTRPDPAGHVGYFLWGHVPEPFTFYRGIRALPAGHTLWADSRGVRAPEPYASIVDTLREAERTGAAVPRTAAERQERLHEALRTSVEAHLVADVPVGVFLSAGLDSTTIAALAARREAELHTVTLGFEEYQGTERDEVPLAEEVAQVLGARHSTAYVSRKDFHDEHDRLLAAMDQPSLDGVNSYFVSRATASVGLKVALSGVGGDELFGGYPSFREIPRLVRTIGWLPGVGTLGAGVRHAIAPLLGWLTSPKYASLLEYGSTYPGAYLLRRGLYLPWELPAFLDPDFVREGLVTLDTLRWLRETFQDIESRSLKITALESTWYMRNQLLRDTDWASMAHSLEVRTPLVDWTLLQQVAPLISADASINKNAMFKMVSRHLPAAIGRRSKSGFMVPIENWFDHDNKTNTSESRGLRNWSRHVYNEYNKH